MFKNVASQKMIFFAFDATTNLPKTGDAANLTAYVSKDFGAVTVLGDTTATEMDATNAKGYYLFDLTQAETNGDTLLFTAKSSTANIVVVGVPATVFTVPANFAATSIDSNGRVDVIKVAGTTQTARDLGNALPALAPGASGGLLISGSNAGTTTFGALTVTGATTHTGATTYTGHVAYADGIDVTCSTLNRDAFKLTGNGVGNGMYVIGGASGDGLALYSPFTSSGNGLFIDSEGPAVQIRSEAGSDLFTLTTAAGGQIVNSNKIVTLGQLATDLAGKILGSGSGAITGVGVQTEWATDTGTAQAGGASTITLRAGSSATDSLYNGQTVHLSGGTGAGQSRVITGYVGSTKVATVGRAWQTNPDATSVYVLHATDAPKTDSSLQVTAGSVQGNVTGSVASVTGAVGSVTAGVTVTTNNDKTGYSLTVTPPTSAQIATAVWQDATAGDFTVASSIGKSLYTSGNVPGAAGGLFIAGTNAATTVTTSFTTTFTGNLTGSVGSVTGAVGSVTGNVGGNVVGSVASVTAAVTVGTINGNVITAAAIADGAIDRATFAADTGHQSIRSNTAQAGGATTITLDASASAVTDFYKNTLVVLTGGTGVGQSRYCTAYNGTTKVATVSSAWGTNPDNTTTFALLAGDAIPGATAPTAAQVATAVWTDLLAGSDFSTAASVGKLLKDDVDAAVSSRMATYTQPTGFLAATFPAGTVASTTNITAGTITTATNVTTVNGLAANVITAASMAADAGAEIAAAVWDLSTTGHTTSGTFGAAVVAAGSAGDPWSTLLPGSYGAGTAGKIVGDNLNATVSSRQASGVAVTLPANPPAGFIVAASFGAGAINAAAVATDAIDADALAADAVAEIQSGLATSATQTTILNRLGAFTGSGLNTVLGFLRALLRKDAALTPSDVGGTFDNTTDALEALRDRGDAAWVTATGFALAADYTTARAAKLDNLDASVLSRMATFALPANFAALSITVGGAVTAGTVSDKTGYALSAAGLNLVLIDGVPFPTATAYIAAATAGTLSGAGSGTEVIRGLNGSIRITATVDGAGNRPVIVYG